MDGTEANAKRLCVGQHERATALHRHLSRANVGAGCIKAAGETGVQHRRPGIVVVIDVEHRRAGRQRVELVPHLERAVLRDVEHGLIWIDARQAAQRVGECGALRGGRHQPPTGQKALMCAGVRLELHFQTGAVRQR